MVIFGASGDLTRRKLMPALYSLYTGGRLPEGFSILGIGRTGYTDETYREYMYNALALLSATTAPDPEYVRNASSSSSASVRTGAEAFCSHLYYLSTDPAQAEGYTLLAHRLQELSGEQEPDNLLFYLATPPSLYGVIPLHLKAAGLNRHGARIIVEKPFGYDLKSAQELNRIYASVFEEHQIYRIDHFLGKETAQNILAFRFANGIFEALWNRNYIEYVEVTAVENIGIEQRGGFYDGTGALRDMVQNHLIQLVALTAMEPPAVFTADAFRNEVVKVYESLKPLTTKSGINNWRWSGVPFYIRTGKQMPTKVTEIVVHFRETPHQMFRCQGAHCPRANQLILRLQPNEGIVLKFGMKVPGSGFDVKQVMMDFSYDQLGGDYPTGDAYARLIEDCIQGDPTLFTRSDAVEASWRFFDPLLRYWEENPDAPLYGYPAGTWGPLESEAMMHEHNAEWTQPCKNLTNTDRYCEL